MIGESQSHKIQLALQPLMRAVGIPAIEKQLGKPGRFFQNARQRGSLRLKDFLGACAVLEIDPVEFMDKALHGDISSEIRPPRIVTTAWNQFDHAGPGLGSDRLSEIEASLQTKPQATRALIAKELHQASREEVPLLLGICASTLRVESDLDHAEIVLRQAIEMSQELKPSTTEADLLIRRSYVALERQSPSRALLHAQRATLMYARFDDQEGEGRGFLTSAMFHYYLDDHREALLDVQATLNRTVMPRRLIAAHQTRALCYLALGNANQAGEEAAIARQIASNVDQWVLGKLSWLEARCSQDPSQRLEFLRTAQAELCPGRPADCFLLTLEVLEELVAGGRISEAEKEVPRLCLVVEQAAESRHVLRAVSRLVRHRSKLTPELIAAVRQAVSKARDRKLSKLASPEL